MKSLWYLIYYTHLYTFFFTVFQKKRFACLKLLKNVQSEPKLNSKIKIKHKLKHLLVMSYYICLKQYLLTLLY